MGQSNSHTYVINKCNALCPICMCRPNAVPNIAGRFFLINNFECQCNGCNSIFDKTLFYKSPFPTINTTATITPTNENNNIYIPIAPVSQIMERDTYLETNPIATAYLVEQKIK